MSGELAAYLVKTKKLTNVAARKQIERLQSPIHKLRGLFSEKQSLVYHASSFRKAVYYERLRDAFEKVGKRNFAVLLAIDYHHGIISKKEIANYMFSPTSNIKGHQNAATIISNLTNAQVLVDFDEDHYQLNTHLSDGNQPDFRYYKAIEFSKALVINHFNNWSRNIGLSSFNKGNFNSTVGGFQFAFTAPSYIAGLVQYKNSIPKPGFLIADILMGNKAGIKEVDFFIQKLDAIKASNPSIKLFPALITDGLEIEALQKLKLCRN